MVGLGAPGAELLRAGTSARPAPRRPRTTNDMTTRCGPRPTDRNAASAATPAPTTVPALQAPWKRGMIVVPRRRSTSAASTFMATSQAPLEKPHANSATMSSSRSGARPAPATPAAPSTAAPSTTGRTPSRWMSEPEVGSASTEPVEAGEQREPELLRGQAEVRADRGHAGQQGRQQQAVDGEHGVDRGPRGQDLGADGVGGAGAHGGPRVSCDDGVESIRSTRTMLRQEAAWAEQVPGGARPAARR